MSTERSLDYEKRVAAAGGEDALTASLVKAVKQARRVQNIVVIGLEDKGCCLVGVPVGVNNCGRQYRRDPH